MSAKKTDTASLKKKAQQLRRDILAMLCEAGSGHPGGSLSLVELIVGLYFHALRHRPGDPQWAGRDIFILSKGHGCPALYAALADCGYFPKEELKTLRRLNSRLQGHPQRGLPGIEASTGSLGQGLSIANGIALAARLDRLDRRVYCIMGDGEIQEGQIWEAALTAGHYKLDNLCGIIDNNGYQIDGRIEDTKNLAPIADKWRSFNWHAIEIDGHDIGQVIAAYDEAGTIKGKPTMIVARTVKGKGISFMECDNKWHGVAPSEDEFRKAIEELNN
ncbi:MAG: transketolase [Candidatus Omnitrophica bacterium]|nr:transketolase [Candidatus Omnitrophota bacterium]